MFVKVFPWRSLKTRVTLSTLAIFLVGIWSLAFYASRVLRDEMQLLLGEHQVTTTNALASDLNNAVKQRFQALVNLAVEVSPKALATTPFLQSWVGQRPITRNLFNAGFLTYRRDGTVVDTDKRLVDRMGSNGLGDDAVASAMREGAATVGRPFWDAKLQTWILPMVIPVSGSTGEAVGAIAGWTNLLEPNFLDQVTGQRHPRTGSYILITTKHRLVVAATDKTLVSTTLPEAGVDASVDRLFEADGRFGLSLDRLGREILSTSVKIGAAGWTLSSVLPTDEAFAPIYAMQTRMLLAAVLLSLLAGGLTWWMLRRQFAPMLGAASTLADMTDGNEPLRPLDIPKQDEVGALIGGFNRLLQTLHQREQALRDSEKRFRTIVERSPEAVVVQAAGTIIYANPAALSLLGAASPEVLLGTRMSDRLHPESLELAHQRLRYVQETGGNVGPAHMRFFRMDGSEVDVEAQATSIVFDGVPAIHTVLHDLTQRRLADEEQRIAATAFESQQGMLVADSNWKILRVNRAFTEITGFSSDDVVGHTPLELLRSDYHNQEYFDAITAVVERDGTWAGEIWDRHKSGKVFPQWVSVTAVKDAAGQITHYVDTMTDITQRKLADEELRIAATAFESQQGMLVTDENWVILRVNRAFTDITGYTSEDAVGKTPQQLLRSQRQSADFFVAMTDTLARTGSWQGEMWDRRKNGEDFPLWLTITAVTDAAGRVTHYVDTMTDITERKLAEEQIQNLAFYDPLTQLPNRRLLMDRLSHAMAHWSRHKRHGALLFVDLDNFKILNDSFGHHKGDLLLQSVATRLSTCIRKGDTVARLGGDEFVVMLEGLSVDPLEAATLAEAVGDKVLNALNQGYLLGEQAHHSTPSIGITLFGSPHEGIEEPLKRADMAMYQAKASGRNTLRFFDPQMQSAVATRAALEAGMREALLHQEFLLHYQAQVAGKGEFTGVEVLVRWNHPERGMVSPAEFIPLAEDTGLILPLGLWVLETACTQLARWAEQPELEHLTVAVNVSPRQFYQSNFVPLVLDVLARSGAKPQRLKLELTEGLLVSNVEDVIAKMEQLKAVGVGFSLDDFGTGYSSLSHLKRLPLDQLKIDQGFVRDILSDPNDAAIANMVIVLGNSLGLSVIAEGVETEAQRAVLAAQGCHAYQGYLFSRPLPLADFEALVRRGV